MKCFRWIDTMVAVVIVALAIVARGPWGVVWANGTCGSAACGSGFNASYHDFVGGPGAKSYGNVTATNGTLLPVGQCTLCHTPHYALLTQLLWNHHLSNNTQFTWDVTNTFAGTPYATIANSWNGPTTKCLSCHDGSVSPSTINWFEDQTPQPGNPSCAVQANGTTTCGHGPIAGYNGQMGPYSFLNTNGTTGSGGGTHPVAMPYPCNGNPNTYDSVTTGAGIVSTQWVAQPILPVRLYQQNGISVSRVPPGGCTGTNNGIECTSCHDVHNEENLDIDLLRGYVSGNGANYICNECHKM